MIRQFFKEYSVWYLAYILLSILFTVIFALYRLPLAYFKVSILINLTILIFISIWQYLKFKQKLSILHYFIYAKELDELELPSELAYKDIIIKLKETSANELLNEKAQTENPQNPVRVWSHQMKVPISALSLMAQTDQLDSNEVQRQLTRLQNYLDTLLTYLKFGQNKDDFRFGKLSVRDVTTKIIKKYRIPCLLRNLSVEVVGDWGLSSDRKWLSFAISQIIDNAVKYFKTDGTIIISIGDGNIVISDDGTGILEEDLPRLSDEGSTGFNGHEHREATGLELYMTKQVLDTFNPNITIDSRVDKGTQVEISSHKN